MLATNELKKQLKTKKSLWKSDQLKIIPRKHYFYVINCKTFNIIPDLVKTLKRIKQDNRIIDQPRIPSFIPTLINTTY